MKASKKYTKIISVCLTILSIVFSFFYAKALIADLDLVGIDKRYLAVSIVSFIIFYLLLSYHWYRAVKMVDNAAAGVQSLAFFASQPYKYLPSSLFTFSFRAKYAHDLGLSLKKSSKAQLIENMVLLSSGLYVGVVFLAIKIDVIYGGVVFLVTLLGAVLAKDNLTMSIKSKKMHFNKNDILMNFALVSIAWIVCGLSFFYLNKAVGVNLVLVDSVASNSIAYVSGILAFFAPGGVGVREAVYGFFSVQVSAILMWRLITFILDVVMGFMSIVIVHYRKPEY